MFPSRPPTLAILKAYGVEHDRQKVRAAMDHYATKYGQSGSKTNIKMKVLTSVMVVLGAQAVDKADAIRQAGVVLVKAGCVEPSYVDGMLARERAKSTYLGSGIAIPHGEFADLRSVHRTGVSVLQLPEGVDWEPGERAFLVIGLASTDDEHVTVLANLVELLQAPENITQLVHATDPMVIVNRLTLRRSEIGWN